MRRTAAAAEARVLAVNAAGAFTPMTVMEAEELTRAKVVAA
jgi:hypothetical protein